MTSKEDIEKFLEPTIGLMHTNDDDRASNKRTYLTKGGTKRYQFMLKEELNDEERFMISKNSSQRPFSTGYVSYF